MTNERNVRDIFGLLNTEGEVGIEIEVEGEHVPVVSNNYWRSDNDGSLRGSSMEYVLNRPVKRNKVVTALNHLKKSLADQGARLDISDRCGVHIHLNVQDLTFMQVMTFACLYLMLEEVLVKFCGEEREGNLFCLRAKDADYLVTGLRSSMYKQDLHNLQNAQYRYASLNMTALSKYGSMEFRAMRSTEDFDIIAQWAEILLRLKDQSLEFDTPVQLVETMSAAGADAFIERILGPLVELVQCPGMPAIVMNGVRMSQNIAYTKPKEKPKRKTKPKSSLFADDGAPAGRAMWQLVDDVVEPALLELPIPDLPRGVEWTRELNALWDEANSIARNPRNGPVSRRTAGRYREEVYRKIALADGINRSRRQRRVDVPQPAPAAIPPRRRRRE